MTTFIQILKNPKEWKKLLFSLHIFVLWRWIKIAFIDILANKLRFLLTILGILIGTGSVILLINVGESAKAAIYNTISGLGENVVYIFHGKKTENSMMMDPSMLIGGFSLSEAKRIKNVLSNNPYVKSIAFRGMETTDIETRFSKNTSTVWIVDSNYFKTINLTLVDGRFISKDMVEKRRKVVILGKDAAEEYFPRSKAVGHYIKIKGKAYKVIGVTNLESSASVQLNSVVFLPYSTAEDLFSNIKIQLFFVKLTDINKLHLVENQMRLLTNKPFYSMTQEEVLDQTQLIMGILTMFISVIASISLIVGGIGVMNILLVSVKEKIKEIGLRKAVGAKNRDILQLFLIQSLIYNLIGSSLGIALGIAGGFVIVSVANLPFVVSIKAIILATSVSFIISLIFGIYPAIIASRLSPVEALREE